MRVEIRGAGGQFGGQCRIADFQPRQHRRALAAQAQRAAGPGKSFRLAVRHVQNMLGLSDQAEASRALRTLEKQGILLCIERGTKTVPGGPPGKPTLWQFREGGSDKCPMKKN